jgi:hypothetical protein
MRRFALIVGLMLVSLVVASPAMAATTQTFDVRFNEGFGRGTAHPCPPSENFSFCGTGIITGFGEATSFTEVLSFENFDPETLCGDVVARRTITLADGSTLVLMETGIVCFTSPLNPRSPKSFGGPYTVEETFTIVSGTGVFAGAQGTGTVAIKAAGDSSHSTLSGTITLP